MLMHKDILLLKCLVFIAFDLHHSSNAVTSSLKCENVRRIQTKRKTGHKNDGLHWIEVKKNMNCCIIKAFSPLIQITQQSHTTKKHITLREIWSPIKLAMKNNVHQLRTAMRKQRFVKNRKSGIYLIECLAKLIQEEELFLEI